MIFLLACLAPADSSPPPTTEQACDPGVVVEVQRQGEGIGDLEVVTATGAVAPQVQILPTSLLVTCPNAGGTILVEWL